MARRRMRMSDSVNRRSDSPYQKQRTHDSAPQDRLSARYDRKEAGCSGLRGERAPHSSRLPRWELASQEEFPRGALAVSCFGSAVGFLLRAYVRDGRSAK